MAGAGEAGARRRLHWTVRYLVPVALVTTACLAAVIGARDDAPREPTRIAVRSTGAVHRTLADLLTASDLVVEGVVVDVGGGRLFSDAGTTGVRSQIVSVRIRETLAGNPPGSRVAIEEEATTANGRPLEVDGLRPAEEGDIGIFFLVRPDPSVPYFVTASTAGRYLAADGAGDQRLSGAVGTGPLAPELAALGRAGLLQAIRDTAPTR